MTDVRLSGIRQWTVWFCEHGCTLVSGIVNSGLGSVFSDSISLLLRCASTVHYYCVGSIFRAPGSIDPRTTAGAGHHTEPFLTPSPIARRLDSDLPGIVLVVGEPGDFSCGSTDLNDPAHSVLTWELLDHHPQWAACSGTGESRRFSTCSVLAAWRGSCFSNGATISPSVIDDSAIDSPTGERRDPSDASQGHSSRPPGGPSGDLRTCRDKGQGASVEMCLYFAKNRLELSIVQ
ncbi:hypothetical protein T02_6684 [Trichinella nativa]|uniref:Uncharacterized protein n=1 Tax=Trichinella nativa TaxID=6335 RepID=A0A0V1LVE0_9BILA|nr:hypothetical protein T02_6684 [Trichinella nativa]